MITASTMTQYPQIDQEVHEATLDNGLKVVLLKKPGFKQKYLTFSTHYGGNDSVFIRPGEAKPTTVPDGIAHFLEHKLFEEPDGSNVLDQYSRMGASPNAYTGSFYTVYLCSLVDQFTEGFDLLLDYVQRPYFTDESVEKEQGIIEQEIHMGRDSPQREAYYALIESLFHAHPARTRVIGSVESIHQIDKDLLYLCHDTFYHPSNMIVTVTGDVEFDQVLDMVVDDMAGRDYKVREAIRRPMADEPEAVKEDQRTISMRVSRPFAMMGFKGVLDPKPSESKSQYHARILAAELALQSVLGRTNQTYWDLYERGVIASQYGYNLSIFPGAAFFYVQAESEDAEAFQNQVTAALVRARDEGIDEERFEEARKREIGSLASLLDVPESLVGIYVTHQFRDLDLFERRQLLDQVDINEAQAFLRDFVQDGRRSVAVVNPQ